MATLIGLKSGTTNISVSYTEGGVTVSGSVTGFVVEALQGDPPVFNNSSVSAQLAPTTATNSPAVNCGAFTAATAGHGGSITYSIVSVKNSSNVTQSGWTLTTTTSRILKVPASTPGGIYTAVVTATEAATDTYTQSSSNATITITVNKKAQTAPNVTSQGATYATSGSISGGASGGGQMGTLYYMSDANGGTNYGAATTTVPSRSRSSVGTTNYIAYWGGNDYWAASPYSTQGGLTVYKRDVTITAPTSTNTVYNTVAQTIFNAGSCTSGGTVYYSTLDTLFVSSKWTTTIPFTQRTDAGTYGLYWYCYVPDTNNNQDDTSDGYAINSKYNITATISKATPCAPILTSGYRATYNGQPVYATAKVSASCSNPSTIATPAGTIYYSTTSGATTYSVVASTTATTLSKISQTNVGSKRIWTFFRPNDTTNYNDSANISTTVKVSKKATGTITYAVQASSVWCTSTASTANTTDASKTLTISTASASTNTGGAITYAVSVKNSGGTDVTGWTLASDAKTITTSAATAAGTYTVTVTAVASSTTNYTSATVTTSNTVTISAVALSAITLALTAASVSYNSSTTVSDVTIQYNNGQSKSVLNSVGVSTTSNPRVFASDTTIASITKT